MGDEEVGKKIGQEIVRKALSLERVQLRNRAIEELLISGTSTAHIVRIIRKEFGSGTDAIRRVIGEVRERWREERLPELADMRLLAERRLLRHIASAAKKERWAAVATLENQLAQLQGLYAPVTVKVEHEHKALVVAVVAAMSPDEIDRLGEEWEEAQRRAALVTKGETVE